MAGSDADTGPGGGGQFQLVTKSGTNTFHGNLNEYHRDPSLVANSWFSNNSTPKVPRNHLIQNQFGGNIGGPIIRNRLFFFFNYLNSKVISGALVQRTVPSPALRAGTVSYYDTDEDVQTVNEARDQGLRPAGDWRRHKLADLHRLALPSVQPTTCRVTASTRWASTSMPQTTTT